MPVFKWQDRAIARLSVQGYNSKPQMDLLIEALTSLLDLRPRQEAAAG
jgi:isopenicillin-N epimerase